MPMRPIKRADDYRQMAAARDCAWVGDLPYSTALETTWECFNKHRWNAPYSSLRQGRGCPFCSGKARKTETDYCRLADSNGYEWIGAFPRSTSRKTRWRCSQLHEWEASYQSVQQGTGCPFCAGKLPKTEDDYKALGIRRGIWWIAECLPASTASHTEWSCAKDHRWLASYNQISRGRGCPVCASNSPKTAQDFADLAERRGFTWMGQEVVSVRVKTWWRCALGHEWEAHFNSIQQGSGCPKCARGRR